MDFKVCLFLVLLGVVCCTASELASPDLLIMKTEDVSALWISNLQAQRQLQLLKDVSHSKALFTMCEKFTATALGYLANNKTQTKMLDLLLKTCSKMPVYKHECTAMVDQYVPLSFLKISTIKPDDICQKVDLCQKVVSISQQFSQNGCDLCHQVVRETLSKMKDPDTQSDILQLLLKACGSVEKYTNKCKKMVFKYAPVILINAEYFLEKNDVCTILFECQPVVGKDEALPKIQTSLHKCTGSSLLKAYCLGKTILVSLCARTWITRLLLLWL
ncbi:prosaposin-like isoform X1 [Solanum tuberosum]|uniref:prosaposin-like isoform X1 n=1 Tax=Solanum tuberosum TaxID=4113 RepID=UPI0003D28421|nr:PREDICTED: prosaposin-like isoform X1 [Solanum tuberosum]XP_006338960.1 PREDICTED: prosaposin-like isoform X1 [Solanum tuberosum]